MGGGGGDRVTFDLDAVSYCRYVLFHKVIFNPFLKPAFYGLWHDLIVQVDKFFRIFFNKPTSVK